MAPFNEAKLKLILYNLMPQGWQILFLLANPANLTSINYNLLDMQRYFSIQELAEEACRACYQGRSQGGRQVAGRAGRQGHRANGSRCYPYQELGGSSPQ